MDTSTPIWQHASFTAPVNFILDARIVEYDIEKANISVLLDSGVISEQQYNMYYAMDKMEREIAIGKLQLKDKKVTDMLKLGITKARKHLCERLNLDYTNVLSIKNDAIFIISSGFDLGLDVIQVSPHVRFRRKGVFRSYYKLARKEFFYDFNPITRQHIIDIKGLGDYAIGLQNDFMIAELCNLFYTALSNSPRVALIELTKFYNSYMNKELPIEFYRRLDSNCRYDLNDISEYARFQADYLIFKDKRNIDVSYNAKLLSVLSQYFVSAALTP